MEKESLKNAEIEKLKQIITLSTQEEEKVTFKDPATSVLCVKCKKGLDDLENIRAAVLGDGGGSQLNDNGLPHKLACENYRILLPNLKGRKPFRPMGWQRMCMRSILFTKMREDVNLLSIKGEIAPMPQFCYSWFDRDVMSLRGVRLSKTLVLSDEDRWGLYYGVKSLTREKDPEALLFWTLLDEANGEDGLQFICFCLSVALSVGGIELWTQLGDVVSNCANITMANKIAGISSIIRRLAKLSQMIFLKFNIIYHSELAQNVLSLFF